MNIELYSGLLESVETDALAVLVFEKEDPFGPRVTASAALRAALEPMVSAGDITGKLYETVQVFQPAGLAARRLVAIGGGKREKFSPFELRRCAGVAVRALRPKALADVVFVPEGDTAEIQAAAEGAVVADLDPGRFKTSGRNDKHLGRFRVAGEETAAAQAALECGRIIGESQNFARDLINEPGNYLTPTVLAEKARAMAAEVGLQCAILDRARCEELKMGSFLSVALGSAEPPAFIVLRYESPQAPQDAPLLGLVGKGITFDTGGISIKPAENMDKMKYDMAGGAAMLGAMRAIALLKPAVRVFAFIPATENMPGGKAQKPGDVRIAMSGKSIEIINTDAEGRLVLADALHYAKTLGCTHLVDAATLTGAIGVALGQVNAGVFTNNEEWQGRLLAAAKEAGERMWPMPLDDDYLEQIRGTVADLLNTGGRYGGACTAAAFLKEFAVDTPWIHLDIAGTAWIDDNKPYQAKGASGIAVRTLTRLALAFGAGA